MREESKIQHDKKMRRREREERKTKRGIKERKRERENC